MATITVTIQEFTGNFVAGNTDEQIAGINIEQSICNYQTAVEDALSGYNHKIRIEWDVRHGEGDPKHRVTAEDEYNREYYVLQYSVVEDILFTADAVRERVFSQGEFWVTK